MINTKLKSDRLYINLQAVLFYSQTDKNNNYTTIVYNSIREKFLEVNSSGYWLLYLLEKNPGIDLEKLIVLVTRKTKLPSIGSKKQIEDFLEEMIANNIVRITKN